MCCRGYVYVQGEIQYLHLVRQGRGGVYTPITDFNIDSNPITDPITDFDECWRLTITSSHWARPAPSRKHTVTMYVV